jgi:type IV secretion system protein VirB10
MPEERQMSPVGSGRRFLKSKSARYGLMAASGIVTVGFVVMGIVSIINDKGPDQKPSDTGSAFISQVTQAPPLPAPPEPVKAEAPPATKVIYVPAVAAPTGAPPPVVSAPTNFVQFPAGSGGEGFFEVPAHQEAKAEGTGGAGKAEDAPKTQVAFKPSTLLGGKAGPAIRLTYVMMPQLIPCALDTAMDSTLAGAIMCHTTQDVLSPDHILLLPAGTNIVGTYKNDVRNGQHRLFAFTGNAITKEGIPVALDSGISDGVGRAGIEGDVDNHYMERFGAAILLTAADSAVQIAQTELSKQGQTSLNLNTGSGASGIANEILRSQITIPPTITVPPGTIVSVVIDHPIDFSDAIKVSAR